MENVHQLFLMNCLYHCSLLQLQQQLLVLEQSKKEIDKIIEILALYLL
jgi:hypothetical protein